MYLVRFVSFFCYFYSSFIIFFRAGRQNTTIRGSMHWMNVMLKAPSTPSREYGAAFWGLLKCAPLMYHVTT